MSLITRNSYVINASQIPILLLLFMSSIQIYDQTAVNRVRYQIFGKEIITYLRTYLRIYLLTYVLTYILSYLLHGAESFLKS
jgi:hypothetical protein